MVSKAGSVLQKVGKNSKIAVQRLMQRVEFLLNFEAFPDLLECKALVGRVETGGRQRELFRAIAQNENAAITEPVDQEAQREPDNY
jgi:hypothetical protein